MNNKIINLLFEQYKGKLIKQTNKEIIVYIDDIATLDILFNDQEKDRHKYNMQRLKFRLEDLDLEENTLIGKMLIVKIAFLSNGRNSFTLTPSCDKLAKIIKINL